MWNDFNNNFNNKIKNHYKGILFLWHQMGNNYITKENSTRKQKKISLSVLDVSQRGLFLVELKDRYTISKLFFKTTESWLVTVVLSVQNSQCNRCHCAVNVWSCLKKKLGSARLFANARLLGLSVASINCTDSSYWQSSLISYRIVQNYWATSHFLYLARRIVKRRTDSLKHVQTYSKCSI